MIKIQDNEIEIDAENVMVLMTEISALVDAVSTQVSTQGGLKKEDIEEDIFKSLRFRRLIDSGMDADQAYKEVE